MHAVQPVHSPVSDDLVVEVAPLRLVGAATACSGEVYGADRCRDHPSSERARARVGGPLVLGWPDAVVTGRRWRMTNGEMGPAGGRLFALTLVLAACSSDDDGGGDRPADDRRRDRQHRGDTGGGGGGTAITIVDFAFDPTRSPCPGPTDGHGHEQRQRDPHVHARRRQRRRDDRRPARPVDRHGGRVRGHGLPLPLPPADDRHDRGRVAGGPASDGAQTENESPQAHSCVARGFSILSPPPRSASLNSRVEPSTIGALLRSTSDPDAVRGRDHVVVLASGASANDSS